MLEVNSLFSLCTQLQSLWLEPQSVGAFRLPSCAWMTLCSYTANKKKEKTKQGPKQNVDSLLRLASLTNATLPLTSLHNHQQPSIIPNHAQLQSKLPVSLTRSTQWSQVREPSTCKCHIEGAQPFALID